MVVLASAGGNDVATIARLVQTSPDRVREMIHRFNDLGMRSLDPQWAGGRPRRITTNDRALIVKTAKTRSTKLGRPFTHWSIRKLADYLATKKGRKVRVGRERLRQILVAEGITFQRTKTWKESPDPLKEQKLARIEWCLEHARDRTFAFDEFGPLTIKPVSGAAWAPRNKPQRLRANYHKPHGSRQLFACYSIGEDHLWGMIEPAKGADPTLRALESIRVRLDDGQAIHVILDNLNHHRGRAVREWCEANNVELVFTPTYASWANPIEAHFGPLHQFVLATSDHADHPALGQAIRSYLRWRNTHTRDPELLEAERRHRARIRSEQQRRWGHPKRRAA
jgi:DDE superfamily endonuclease/Homeodomain-like domain